MDSSLRGSHAFAALTTCLLAGSALADITLYEEDFESGSLSSFWDANSSITYNPHLTHFNGRHSKDAIELVIPLDKALATLTKDRGSPGGGDGGGDTGGGGDGGGSGGGGGDGGGSGGGGDTGGPLPAAWLEFDLYIIDSWDGATEFGTDYFEVLINGSTSFRESFDNHGGPQSFRAPDERAQFGFNAVYLDSVYRDIRIPIELDPQMTELRITFRGVDLQNFMDESFGIDNVSLVAVPSPGGLTLGLAGLAGLARRRRSRH